MAAIDYLSILVYRFAVHGMTQASSTALGKVIEQFFGQVRLTLELFAGSIPNLWTIFVPLDWASPTT
jgi:hypothetical protein